MPQPQKHVPKPPFKAVFVTNFCIRIDFLPTSIPSLHSIFRNPEYQQNYFQAHYNKRNGKPDLSHHRALSVSLLCPTKTAKRKNKTQYAT